MKKIIFGLFAAIIFVLASCGGTGDVKKILNTVPKDTKVAVSINIEKINSKLESDGESLSELILNSFGSEMDSKVKYFFSEGSPVDFNAPAAFFEMKNAPVLTFYSLDPEGFRSHLKSNMGYNLSQTKGVWSDSSKPDIFMKDNQVWFTSGYPRLQPEDFSGLASLNENESIMSLPAASEVFNHDSDVCALLGLEELSDSYSDFAQFLSFTELIFDNPEYLGLYADFKKGEMTATAVVLDKKGKQAPTSINFAKIDTGKLKEYSGKGDFFFAMGVDSDFIDQAMKQAGRFGLPAEASVLLKTLDGNIVISGNAMSFANTGKPDLTFSIGFKDNTSASTYAGLLGGMMPPGVEITPEGKSILIKAGNPSGVGIEEVATDFDGAVAGVAFVTSAINDPKAAMASLWVKGGYVMLKPDGDSVKIELVIESSQDANSLSTLFSLLQMVK